MKSSSLAFAAAFTTLALAPVVTFGSEPVEGRAATSRAQLIDRVKNQSAVAVATPEEQRPRWDLAQHSEFITFSGDTTLLPKKAVLQVPDKYREFITPSAKGKVVSWPEFAAKYPAFILSVEVTLDQASGKTALDPKVLENAAKSGRIAVAVLNGQPISTFQATPPAAPAP